jgi:hypothetical protein
MRLQRISREMERDIRIKNESRSFVGPVAVSRESKVRSENSTVSKSFDWQYLVGVVVIAILLLGGILYCLRG